MREAPISKMFRSPYDAAKLLADLRNDVGIQRFGLVVQALFAHVLLRLGGNVLDVKNPGHPDIRAVLAGQMYNIEVETAGRKTLPRQLEQGDLDVLQVRGDGGTRLLLCIGLRPSHRVVMRGRGVSGAKGQWTTAFVIAPRVLQSRIVVGLHGRVLSLGHQGSEKFASIDLRPVATRSLEWHTKIVAGR